MSEKFPPRKDAIFTVLNDWLDLPQDLFEKIWPELETAVQALDPLPYVHRCWDDGTCSNYGKRRKTRGVNDEFEPRDGFSKNEDDYG